MSKSITVLGIDCGGTHTDAALLEVKNSVARLIASAKTITQHDNLPASIAQVLELLAMQPGARQAMDSVERITLGTTLEVNAIVENRADKPGLILSAGPGLAPDHFAIGEHVYIVPGGLDHRGVKVAKLQLDGLAAETARWAKQGIKAIACVGKFSPRNPEHENKMAEVAAKETGLPVTLGHTLSGRLNFPRRIATAYFNAAVARLHESFLDAMEQSFAVAGLKAQCRLLKADGGAAPFAVSRKTPVQSILSGPAASVMGALALWANASEGCSLLLDIGGTTTDIALFLNGSPVIDRRGMALMGRRTLVNSLASVSIGVGGDSLLRVEKQDKILLVKVLPRREGPAMAFGGKAPTLLDALNTLDGNQAGNDRGDLPASRRGLEELAANLGLETSEATELAKLAVEDALIQISTAAADLVEKINSRPIYTLAALKAAKQARPDKACLVGGPAHCIRDRLAAALGMPVEISPNPQVANAIGAALTIPTASLEVWADTGKGELSAPELNYTRKIPKNFGLEDTKKAAMELMADKMAAYGDSEGNVQIVEADLFATLDDYGRGSRDMRVQCQARPGILAKIAVQ